MMTKQEVLTKAILKAKKNGCKVDITETDYGVRWIDYGNTHQVLDDAVPTELFYHPSHEFAKALWGEENPYVVSKSATHEHTYEGYAWQYHLKQMVTAENPIQYLADNMGADE